jgi:solute carrier family 25 carnitine/acylcarnitine transporter 20/29
MDKTDINVIFSSFLSGISQVLFGHPFDTIKVLKQNNNNITSQSYKNLYKGMKYPIIQTPIINIANFYSTYYFQKKYKANLYFSTIFSGIISSIIVTPFDHYKIMKQNNIQYSYKINNILLSYKYLHVVTLREIPSLVIYFNSYEYLKRYTNSYLLSGGVSGILSWGFTYPIDTIKTRLQSNNANNFKDAILQKNLYRGIVPCLIRAFIVNGLSFYIYEYFYNIL